MSWYSRLLLLPFPPLSFFGSRFISRAVKTENPVLGLSHSPKQHGNACYAGYSNLNCIYLLQKRMVRLISKAHHLANTVPLFSKLKVLDIYSIYSFSVATFMYSYHHNLLPSSFRNLFLSSNQVHHHEIRIASQYRPHFCRTKIKQFSILYGGPSIWNSLPVTLTSSSSLFVF